MPLNDDQLRAIGRISVHSNELELSLNVLVWGLINPNINIGRIVLEGESYDRMLGRVKKLAQEVSRENPELGSRIQQWAGRVNDVKSRRNEVLHAQWTLDQPTGEMVGLTILRKEMREVDASVDKLNRLADDMVNVRDEVTEIIRAMPSFPPQPWFPKQSS
jgi:hypothetical protein